jgi:hypothetical protein
MARGFLALDLAGIMVIVARQILSDFAQSRFSDHGYQLPAEIPGVDAMECRGYDSLKPGFSGSII